jgi:hypothetical protein
LSHESSSSVTSSVASSFSGTQKSFRLSKSEADGLLFIVVDIFVVDCVNDDTSESGADEGNLAAAAGIGGTSAANVVDDGMLNFLFFAASPSYKILPLWQSSVQSWASCVLFPQLEREGGGSGGRRLRQLLFRSGMLIVFFDNNSSRLQKYALYMLIFPPVLPDVYCNPQGSFRLGWCNDTLWPAQCDRM